MTGHAVAGAGRTGSAVLLGLGLWLLAALGLSASGAFYGVPAPVVGITNWSLVAAVLLAVYRFRPLRAWVMAVPLRWLVLYHATRFVGIAFLVLHARGELPAAFALPAGWGDIVVATSSLLVGFAALPATTRGRWWAVLLWNGVGLLDILMVIGTGLRLGLEDMDQMAALTGFPLSLLPTFVVPLIIATHVLIFVRLWEMRGRYAA